MANEDDAETIDGDDRNTVEWTADGMEPAQPSNMNVDENEAENNGSNNAETENIADCEENQDESIQNISDGSNASNDSEPEETFTNSDDDDSGKENARPDAIPNASTPIVNEAAPVTIATSKAESMPPPAVASTSVATRKVTFAKPKSVFKERQASSVSDSGSIGNKIQCFECEENFFHHASFVNHLKSMHNMTLVEVPISEVEFTPGKFVRAPTKNKRKRKSDAQENKREHDEGQMPSQNGSSYVNPMGRVIKRSKRSK